MNASQMTKQEIFDHVATNLIKQGCRSVLEDRNGCAYHGDNGAKCAAGWLMDDDKYRPNMEGESVYDAKVAYALGFVDYADGDRESRPENLQFLAGLQNTHDKCFLDVDSFKSAMYDVALEHNLNPAVLA